MTCVVWKDGVMAADRNTGLGVIAEWEEQKIFKLNGYLLGFSGFTSTRDKIITWIVNEKDDKFFPEINPKEDYSFILIDCINKKFYLYDNSLEPSELPYDYPYAIGSLQYLATGAMYVGANAKEAVDAALRTYKLRPEVKFFNIDVISDNFENSDKPQGVENAD